jgi:hypothetical protein
MIVFEEAHLHVADWHRWENPGDFLAAKLLQGILTLGISRYHPNPKAAACSCASLGFFLARLTGLDNGQAA